MGDPISIGLGIGSLVLGAAGSAYSANEQRKASKEQSRELRKAQEAERNIDIAKTNEQAARDRRSQIREARIKRAMVANTAAVSGQGAGSGAITGGQAVTQQAGVNVGNINTAMSWSNISGNAAQNTANAANATVSPGVGSQLLGGVGSTLMQMGTQKTVQSIFKE